jgi:hypothetical protein
VLDSVIASVVNTGNIYIKDLPLLQSIQFYSLTFVLLVLVVTLPAVEARTTHLHLVSRLRMSCVTPALPYNDIVYRDICFYCFLLLITICYYLLSVEKQCSLYYL